jgi:hypothetical protein
VTKYPPQQHLREPPAPTQALAAGRLALERGEGRLVVCPLRKLPPLLTRRLRWLLRWWLR